MPGLTLDGTRLDYTLSGQGKPALVLIHGGCCARSDWAAQAADLAREFAVLTFDLRGHGHSGGAEGELSVARWAADVNTLIEALDLSPVVIVGHSLGSRIAAEAVWQKPDNAAALVLLDGSRTVGGRAASTPSAGAPPPRHEDQSLAAILDRTIGPYADDAVRTQVIATMSAPPEPVMWAAVRALEDWDRDRADIVLAGLPVDLPVLAIQSTYHDKFTPRRTFTQADETSPYLDGLRAALPQLRVAVLPETGHFSMMERPEAVTALIRDFARAASEEESARWPKSA
ncbi:alpha/beta fold hydrolase [Novosphingobium sp. JCM 18896]|uniref:alpha/beta fold hydrolase n=1 Tax=Novosphingobium sp. JCM 18896 TaxID=2989731 RepID=UPI002221EFB8|nr:alpha/beta hydrolase [Novosphingobium sp. JCM 18896]MCW1427537.1 alpha/beta hydrolase [Novosphingobium sp. JCM 18896]